MKTKTIWLAAAMCLSAGMGMGASTHVEAGVSGAHHYGGPLCIKRCDYAYEACLLNGGSQFDCEDQWFSCVARC